MTHLSICFVSSLFNKLQWIHRNLFICSTPVGFFLFFFFYCKNEKQKTRRQCLLKEEKKNTKRNVECYHWLSGKLNFFFLFFVYCWENSWFCSRWSLGSQFLQRERKKRFYWIEKRISNHNSIDNVSVTFLQSFDSFGTWCFRLRHD